MQNHTRKKTGQYSQHHNQQKTQAEHRPSQKKKRHMKTRKTTGMIKTLIRMLIKMLWIKETCYSFGNGSTVISNRQCSHTGVIPWKRTIKVKFFHIS